MKASLRHAARYWYILLVPLVVVGFQFRDGFKGQASASSRGLWAGWSAAPTPTRAPLPTFTATARPTFTPSPTRTPTFTSTATGTPYPSDTPQPSATPTSTFTPSPQPTPQNNGLSLTVPILMYHYVSDPPPGADAIRLDLSAPPARFETHLAYLRQAGYETVTMRDLSLALAGQITLPEKPVVISFDDGYRDNYQYAFPLLRQYGYTGIFFVFTQVIDTYNVDYLTWEMVQEMHQAGMEFGSHSYRHSDLSERDVDFLVYEILGSKEAIEERIGEPVRFLSYPAGWYDDLTIRVVESANFWGAVTTQWGHQQSYQNRFEMPRLRIRGSDTADDLALKLAAH